MAQSRRSEFLRAASLCAIFACMTELLDIAIKAASRLSREQQDLIAREILERIEADSRWDAVMADPRSEGLMKRLADEARADIARGDILDADPAHRR